MGREDRQLRSFACRIARLVYPHRYYVPARLCQLAVAPIPLAFYVVIIQRGQCSTWEAPV